MKKALITVSIATTLALSNALSAHAAEVTPQQGMTDLFTIAVWSQPATQEQKVCQALKKSPTKATKAIINGFGSMKSLQKELGLTSAQLQAAGLAGVKQACSTSNSSVIAVDAITGVMDGILGQISSTELTGICTAYAANSTEVIGQFSSSFAQLPVTSANTTAGITQALTSLCTS